MLHRTLHPLHSFVFLFAYVVSTSSYAQPATSGGKKSDFFKDNYVGSIGNDLGTNPTTRAPSASGEARPTQDAPKPAEKPIFNDGTTLDVPSDPNSVIAPQPSPSATPGSGDESALNEPPREKIQLKSVGVIVDPYDPQKLDPSFAELIATSLRTHLPLGEVYIPGGFYDRPKTDSHLLSIALQGGRLVGDDKLPPQYSNVTTWPTWILETADGEILLEGFTKLDQLIDSSGQFIPPGRQ